MHREKREKQTVCYLCVERDRKRDEKSKLGEGEREGEVRKRKERQEGERDIYRERGE